MKIAVISDIHGNLTALRAVAAELAKIDGIVMLGDIVDYCPHSNEVTEFLKGIDIPFLCNIRGNHEDAVINGHFIRFSSDRGRASAAYTRMTLTADSWDYLKNAVSPSGRAEFTVNGKKILAVHGSLKDEYWTAIKAGTGLSEYSGYDYVFSGHSHIPHFFEEFYPADDPAHRNKKKTVFVNPGSVGQPRNHCPLAQYVIWDTETDTFEMKKTAYDIKAEQAAFTGGTDIFYKTRLEEGI